MPDMKSMMRSISDQLLTNSGIVDAVEDLSEADSIYDDEELCCMKKRFSTITLSLIKKWYYKVSNFKSLEKEHNRFCGRN